jgi:N-methylhydantoinase B/oxoprolinase/acetone carboxylase alpha subunit
MATISSTESVTASVIRSARETVCSEMGTYVSRTATTPILNQSNERNATIFDQQGRLAALSVGIPQFMLSSALPVRMAIDFFGDAPGVFDLDDDNVAVASGDMAGREEEVRTAAANCPTAAIHIAGIFPT